MTKEDKEECFVSMCKTIVVQEDSGKKCHKKHGEEILIDDDGSEYKKYFDKGILVNWDEMKKVRVSDKIQMTRVIDLKG